MSKKLAVGYSYDTNVTLAELLTPFLDSILELYYPAPELASARVVTTPVAIQQEYLRRDLTFARANKIKLNLLLNAGCYGDDAVSPELESLILKMLQNYDRQNLLPEIVTTTSPFIAEVLKRHYPQIDCRASVNMRIRSIGAMDYLQNRFDSYYLDRDLQRDLDLVKQFSSWCHEHDKKLCILANSGCLRNCPAGIFHENFVAHNAGAILDWAQRLSFEIFLCVKRYKNHHYCDFIKSSWIRPEDLHYYEPYFDVIKLSTRVMTASQARQILQAYSSQHYCGNLLEIVDPIFSEFWQGKYIDNQAFPADWAESKIAGLCANNCTDCGKCDAVLNQVLKNLPKTEN